MALTRPRIGQFSTTVSSLSDPLTVLHAGATAADVDVGFVINRANGLVSNVALYWNEAEGTFVTAYTTSSGVTNSNVVPTSYANLRIGTLTANTLSVAGGGINGVTIGAVTPAAGTFTNLAVTGNVTSDLNVVGNLKVYGTTTSVNTVVEYTTEVVQGVSIVSGNLVANANTSSENYTTGALVVQGGVGVSGNLNVANQVRIGGIRVTGYDDAFTVFGEIVAPAANITTRLLTNNAIVTSATITNANVTQNLTVGGNTTITGTLTASSLNVAGGGLNGVAIGQTTPAAGTFTTANATTFSGNITPATGTNTIYSTGHIVPTANVTYDLGTSTQRFRSLYLSGSTIYLGNAIITTTTAGDVVFNTSGSFAVPVGSTTQRSEIQGAMRFNTTLNKFESFDGATWNTLAYGNASDFPDGDYGDLSAVLIDAFGAKTATGFDCNSDGAMTYADLALVGDAALGPI